MATCSKKEAKQLLPRIAKLSIGAPGAEANGNGNNISPPVVEICKEVNLSLTPLEESGTEADESGFRTPTGEEHRIPEPLVCPPAPNPKKRFRARPSATVLVIRDTRAKATSAEIDAFFARVGFPKKPKH